MEATSAGRVRCFTEAGSGTIKTTCLFLKKKTNNIKAKPRRRNWICESSAGSSLKICTNRNQPGREDWSQVVRPQLPAAALSVQQVGSNMEVLHPEAPPVLVYLWNR